MTSTIQNNQFTEEDEFSDPNWNYAILLTELKERIVDLQYDINNIRDPELLGVATKLYTDLKNNYFNLLVVSMNLEHDIRMERTFTSIEKDLGGNEHE